MTLFEIFRKPNIKKLAAKGNVSGLIKALSYKKDWMVRENAVEVLRNIGDWRAIEPIIIALKNGNLDLLWDPSIKWNLSKILFKLGVKTPMEEKQEVLETFTKEIISANGKFHECLTDTLLMLFQSMWLNYEDKQKILSSLIKSLETEKKFVAKTLGALFENAKLNFYERQEILEALINGLRSKSKNMRISITKTLLSINSSSKLDYKEKQKIISAKQQMIKSHTDITSQWVQEHTDEIVQPPYCSTFHMDQFKHTDIIERVND